MKCPSEHLKKLKVSENSKVASGRLCTNEVYEGNVMLVKVN